MKKNCRRRDSVLVAIEGLGLSFEVGLRVLGLGFGAWGLGFGVEDLGFRVWV